MTPEQQSEALAKLAARMDRLEAKAERIHQLHLALMRLREMEEKSQPGPRTERAWL